MKKHIFWFTATLLISLSVVILSTSLLYDPPSFQDVFGFGGLLFFSLIMVVPLSYLPVMWLFKRFKIPSLSMLRVFALLVLGNIPLYLIMWKQYHGRMSIPEAKLFLIGYLVMAIVYGLLFKHSDDRKKLIMQKHD